MAYGSSAFGSESYGSISEGEIPGTITFFLTGYLLKANIQKTFTIDVKLVLRNSKTLTLNAKLVLRKSQTFLLNAALQKTFTKTFTISGYPAKTGITKSFSLDSKLVHRREITFLLNAALRKTKTNTFGVAARVYYITGWLSPWKCRKLATAIGSGTGSLTNFVFQITVYFGAGTDSDKVVYCNSKVKTDFSDLRFTKQNGTTLLQHEIVSYTSSVSATVNVKLPYLPGTDGLTNFYIYYGNASAVSTSVSTPIGNGKLNNLLETLTVPCTNSSGVTSTVVLTAGQGYIIRLTGTYNFGIGAGTDALYTLTGEYVCYDQVPPGITFAAGTSTGRIISQYLDAGNDGLGNEDLSTSEQVDPDTGEVIVSGYDSVNHDYYFKHTAQGGAIKIYLIDNKTADAYIDNSGSITARIYDTIPAGTVLFDVQQCRAATGAIRTHRVGLRIING